MGASMGHKNKQVNKENINSIEKEQGKVYDDDIIS